MTRSEIVQRLASLWAREKQLNAAAEKSHHEGKDLRRREALGEKVDAKEIGRLRTLADDLGERAAATRGIADDVEQDLVTAINDEHAALTSQVHEIRMKLPVAWESSREEFVEAVAVLVIKMGASLERWTAWPELHLPSWIDGRDLYDRIQERKRYEQEESSPVALQAKLDESAARLQGFRVEEQIAAALRQAREMAETAGQ